MFDVKDKYESGWLCRRFCTLLVEFPSEITLDVLKQDDICIMYDAEEAYTALKSAHDFLTEIVHELLTISNDKPKKIDVVFSKIDLLWALGFYAELYQVDNEYCLRFSKSALKSGKKTLPSSYAASFQNITDNGCYIEYFKNGQPVKDFKLCDNGILRFDNQLTALGLYMFIKKVAQKRWYCETDIAGGYAKGVFEPVNHCIEPYYRIDMRIFTCENRLRYDIFEQLAGYSDQFKGYFKTIYCFVKDHYPDCLPNPAIYRYIGCSVTFGVDTSHRMIGQLGVGHNEHWFGFYGALTGKEVKMALEQIDSLSEKIVRQFLHEKSCNCELCQKKVGVISYKGKLYNNLYKGYENRFTIENEDDVQQAIKILDIKAKCDMNTLAK